ncbi:TetR/AcrR family transcriptional regulator, partial [Mesorhizobium sp. M00.F.Ca.ET.158.01.1.1]
PMSSRLPNVAAYLLSFTGQEPSAGDVEDFSRYVEDNISRNR